MFNCLRLAGWDCLDVLHLLLRRRMQCNSKLKKINGLHVLPSQGT